MFIIITEGSALMLSIRRDRVGGGDTGQGRGEGGTLDRVGGGGLIVEGMFAK